MRKNVCFSVLFLVACMFGGLASAQLCEDGQCAYGGPVKKIVVGTSQVVANTLDAVAEVVRIEPRPVAVTYAPAACAVASAAPVRQIGLAQRKAEQQASEGRMRHVGGGFGGGRYEGVGFSSRSADEAIRSCCYWGRLTPREIGVARGRSGWFACVIYR